jgi:hypothetical protein
MKGPENMAFYCFHVSAQHEPKERRQEPSLLQPFDLKHIRVIYYDVTDPFWGTKLLDKVAENILLAIKNPEEAVFKSEGS